MLKVLLVDDEPFIIQGLKVLIDWEQEGYTIAGTASNGKEAYDFLKKESVDLIIADIQMLKERKSVGMLNACLRLRMQTKDHVCFEIDGEEGAGTWITIRIPMEYL